MIRRVAAIVALALAPGLWAQGPVRVSGTVAPGEVRHCLFALDTGLEAGAADVAAALDVFGPGTLDVRLVDLDLCSTFTTPYEDVATVVSPAQAALGLSLPARKHRRDILLTVRVTEGATGATFTADVTATAGELTLVENLLLPDAGFGIRFLFHRIVEFDAVHEPAAAGAPYKFHVRPDTEGTGHFSITLQTENLPVFVVSDQAWDLPDGSKTNKKLRELLRVQPGLPPGELRATANLVDDRRKHIIWVSRPEGDPAARYRGEMVFGHVSWVSDEEPPFRPYPDDWANCSGAGGSAMGPLAALAALCAAGTLRRARGKLARAGR